MVNYLEPQRLILWLLEADHQTIKEIKRIAEEWHKVVQAESGSQVSLL